MILSIDIGGTAVKLGLVTREGRIVARHEARADFDGYQTPLLDTAMREAQSFVSREGAALCGVGICATGQIDVRQGTVIGTNGKIPNYEGASLCAAAQQTFGVPAAALNDANAAALGEWAAGRGRGCDHLLMITLGTGVGGGIVECGRVLSGARGIAGELGHFTLYQDGEPCACGKRGCFETYASTTALVRAAQTRFADPSLDGRAVFSRVAAGDAAMQSLLDRWIDDIAAGLSGLTHIFNPEMVLVGGGVSAQEQLLIAPLRRKVLSQVMPRFAEDLRIERALLGNDAGLIGAARYLLDYHPELFR